MDEDHPEGRVVSVAGRELMCIIRVQAIARKWIARHKYLRVRKFVIRLQAIVRAWLMAKKLLESVRLHAKRTRVLLEIISIEKAYVQDLFSMVNDFKYPLLNKHILIPTEAMKLFSNIETIYDIHQSLLDSLKTQRREWNFSAGVGVCFLNELLKFEAYQTYILNFDDSYELLRELKANNPLVHKFLKGVEGTKKMRNLDLTDLLIMPVQRIPRYLMLLKEYLKFTAHNHADSELVPKLIINLNRIMTNINSMKRRSLIQEVSGVNFNGLTDYTMEGELTRTHIRFHKKLYIFLFEDIR